MASKSKSQSRSVLPAWLKRALSFLWGPGRAFTAVVLLVAVFLIGWGVVWQKVRPQFLASSDYTVTKQQIELTPSPAWIHTDIRDEVFRNASLDTPLSILDDDLGERIAGAFALHPWIAKVNRVAKSPPNRVEVDVVYRKPVCMIEVPGDLLPVDSGGVLLPAGDFSPIEKQGYPFVAGIDTRPMGPVGQRWGDGRVVDAAEIAAAFGTAWQELKLYRIVPISAIGSPMPEEPIYELLTRAGTHVIWGRAPSSKMVGEPAAAEKVARLAGYAAQNGGSLEGPSGPQQIDVRSLPPSNAKR